MAPDLAVAEAFLEALGRRNFEALEATLHPGVRFRALVPGEPAISGASTDAAACFRRWFGDKTDVELVDRRVERVVDRMGVQFRATLKKNGQPFVIEQHLCGDVEDGRFVTLDLLCTGFRPIATASSHGVTHVFDAGDLGCGSGLPREFRARLAQIPVGHVLEVVTDDPSAREDLPSLARLLGHQVRAIEPGPDGKLRIRVERCK
jgi:TusA-related sulfurtransferase